MRYGSTKPLQRECRGKPSTHFESRDSRLDQESVLQQTYCPNQQMQGTVPQVASKVNGPWVPYTQARAFL
jgi:hypothetical protein